MLLLLLVVAPSLLIFASSSSSTSSDCPTTTGVSLTVGCPNRSVRVVVVLSLCFLLPPARGFFHFTVHFTRLCLVLLARRQRARESYKITSPSLCASTKRTNRANKHRVCATHNTTQTHCTAHQGKSRRPRPNDTKHCVLWRHIKTCRITFLLVLPVHPPVRAR